MDAQPTAEKTTTYTIWRSRMIGLGPMKIWTENGFLPEEHLSQKRSATEDTKYDKTLIYDLS